MRQGLARSRDEWQSRTRHLEVALADKAERAAALEALAQQRADDLAQGKQREQKVCNSKAPPRSMLGSAAIERDGRALLRLISLGAGGRSRLSARAFASKWQLTESVSGAAGIGAYL